jgi:actin-like ATPase involved in cell morphogenesis
MSLIVGIDLGTTNSCIAVPADVDIPGKDRLIADRRLRPFGDALIVTTPDRAPAVPSVVWVGPDGAVLVGLRAKHKARNDLHPPARFFKREMGTDQLIQAGHAELTPVEASAHVLRYLKGMAEDALGVPVERAVITVPAFFDTPAKNDTTRAGELAGLEVEETLIEPVAAALAYTNGIPRPAGSRTFCVYDLGGGTFDTAVVTLDPDSGFDCRAFDGDRFLGGYDFDREIVGWLVGQLPGHRLNFDTEDPAHRQVLAQLTAIAETAKHDLSRFTETEIVDEHAVDLAGEPMSINVPMSRTSFESLIEGALQGTLTHCDRALEKARMTVDGLDDIVMVGGSSRIPFVARLLAEHLGREPRLLNPDLCVAVGAALKAASAAVRSGNLELDQPDVTPPVADVSGRVLPGDALRSVAGVTVTLSSDDGMTELEETTDAAGRFLFPDVPVDEDAENAFSVRVRADGRDIDTRRLVLGRRTGPETEIAGDVLSHDFFVELTSGPYRLVPSETRVPYRTAFTFETARRGVFLSVRIIEDLLPIGDLTVNDLPPDLPEGTPVEVTLEFQPDWTILAEARVPSVGARATAAIELPRRKVPAWTELERRVRELRTSWDGKRGDALPEDVVRVGPMLDHHLAEIEALMAERQDRTKTHHKTLEAETLLLRVRDTEDAGIILGPTLEQFRDAVHDLEEAISELARRNPISASQHRAQVPNVVQAGQAAYEAGDQFDWQRANDLVIERLQAVYRELPMLPIRPDQIRAYALEEIERIRQTAAGHTAGLGGAERSQGEAFIARLDELRQDATTGGDTLEMKGLYRQLQQLKYQIEAWITGGRGPGDVGIKRRGA